MTDRALTEAALLAGLQDIRLPAEAPGGLLAEILVAIGLGLLLALSLASALRLVTSARPMAPRPPSLAERVAALSALPENERQLALLHLLKVARPEVFAALSDRLYRAGDLPACTELEAELNRHV